LCGLSSLVASIIADPKCSNYFIGGFSHMDDRVQKMACVVAVSSCVSDSAMSMLLEDDRLPRQLDELTADLKDEVAYVANLPTGIFEILGKATSTNATEIRHESIAAALIQAGFMENKLREARQPPWSLLYGDRAANLQVLSDGPEPTEETTLKIFQLLRLGYSRSTLLQGLALLAQANWSSQCVEQGHVCASGLMRKHKGYSQGTLQARAMCMQMKPLLQSSIDERKLKASLRRLECLGKCRPNYITGRQAYVMELNETAEYMRSKGRAVGNKISKSIIKNHGGQWAALGGHVKAAYERKAEEVREVRHKELQENIDQVRADIAVRKHRMAQQSGLAQPMRMTAARLSASQQQELDALYASPKWSTERVSMLRARAVEHIGPPSKEYQTILEQMLVQSHGDRPRHPEWLSVVCWHRTVFASSILKFRFAEGLRFCQFVFATQSPLLACFCLLEPSEVVHRLVPPATWEADSLNAWEHIFALQWGSFMYSDEQNFQGECDIEVLLDVVNLPGGICASDALWLPFARLRELLGAEKPLAGGDRQPAEERGTTNEDPCLKHPWLLEHMVTMGAAWLDSCGSIDGATAQGKIDVESGGQGESSDWDVDAEAVMDELLRKRAELAPPDVAEENFSYSLRGGQWTAAKKGVAFDCFLGSAKGHASVAFCEQFAMHRSGSFSIALYGEHEGLLLVKAWVHRMEFLMQVWVAAGSLADFQFSAEDLSRYEGPAELVELLACSKSVVSKRAIVVRSLGPGCKKP
jgi:hypothetical protein